MSYKYSSIIAFLFLHISFNIQGMEKIKEFDCLTQLYRWEGLPLSLSLSKEVQDSIKTTDQLQELFQKHNIETDRINAMGTTIPWETQDWKRALSILKNLEISVEDAEFFIELENLVLLYKKAISTLKSFLARSDFIFCEKNYVKKRNIHRLFTYIKLKHIIEKEKLSHIHLPSKFLAIRKKDYTFAIAEEAEKILDEIIKLEIDKLLQPSLKYSDDYTLFIFAEFKQNHKRPFNEEARKELKKLAKKAPFDTGIDNIFTDENGDAIIIDTEFKGETKKGCLNKLKARYLTRYMNKSVTT